MCGAARTLGELPHVAVCTRLLSQHAGLDHFDPQQGVRWPVCETYCAGAGHICGRVRGDAGFVRRGEVVS
jgi:hypothetical protein